MNKISIISIITLIIVFFTYTILQRSRAQTVTLQSEQKRFLLLDSRIVESSQNAKLEVGTVEKYKANPLFGEDKEWEMRFDNFYGNVMFDEEDGIYKCWYSPFIIDNSAKGIAVSMPLKKYEAPENREMAICYATSKDGIKWEKPNLGFFEFEGNKNNNIVWRGNEKKSSDGDDDWMDLDNSTKNEQSFWDGIHGTGVFKDLHEKDPMRRYKAIFKDSVLSYSTSPDGLNWSPAKFCTGVTVAGDTHNNVFWAPTLNKYVGITRTWGKMGREVARVESQDFTNWTKEEVILEGLDKNLQPYSMPVFYYAGVYLGLIAIHKQSSDKVWTELAWSPDTKKWYRIDAGNPLIPTSEKKLDYDYGCVYTCAYPIFKDNEIQLYYGGSDWLHGGWRNGTMNLATLREDGFAGYVPENENQEGIITTKSLKFNGQDIKLTADVEKGGTIKVTVLNSEGIEITSLETISKTITNRSIKFKAKITEENIKLKFEFNKAKLYSFEI